MKMKIERYLSILVLGALTSCTAPSMYVTQADEAAYAVITEKHSAGGLAQSFTISTAEEQLRNSLLSDQQLVSAAGRSAPSAVPLSINVLRISLQDALQVAAHNNPNYQTNKETIFRQALALDLQRNVFRNSWSGLLSTLWSTNKSSGARQNGLHSTGEGGLTRHFKSGVTFATSIGLDLVQLLTANKVSARGLVADASISVPLLRGSGAEIVAEPLQQSEFDVLYAMWDFERYRRTFAVKVASEYLLVLERMNQVDTAYDNYQRLVTSRQRAQRLADAGRLPGIQVDQALQDELRARVRWVSAQQTSADRLDSFKITLGLPTDARIELDRELLTAQLQQLVAQQQQAAPSPELLATALDVRRDLRIAKGVVADSVRQLRVAEDQLRADVTLLATGRAGERRSTSSVASDDVKLNPDKGYYTALLQLDLPFERTSERNALRNRWIDYEQRQREQRQLEDLIKYQVRSAWRGRLEAFELIQIQQRALTVARRRVASTDLFLQAGRIQIRDLLEAQDDLVSAENSLIEAQVQYRIRAMELMRDIGMLEIDTAGKWLEDINDYAQIAQ